MPSRPPAPRAKAYLKARHRNLIKALDALKLDALLLTHPADLAYLTNFTGHDSIGVFPKKGLLRLVTDFRYATQAKQQAEWVKTTIRETGQKMSVALAKVLTESIDPAEGAEVAQIGFDANFMTYGQVEALRKQLHEAGGKAELVPVEDVLFQQRKVKDDHEINLIRKSVAVAEEAFESIRDQIEPGATEGYLCGLLIAELRGRGAEGTSFEVIVAAGANSALPHYSTGDAPIKRDQPLLFDWGAVVGGYCSDLSRTFMLGRPDPKMPEIYKIVLEAQQAALSVLRPGVTTKQADTAAREVIKAAGYGEQFGHSLGHGIGRDIHELPSLRQSGEEDELRPGMVVTVEPGIYLPDIGGVRIEDDVLITHSGHEVLSSLPRGLSDCTIE
jgi:Xaa-Pro aminopeptidase